MARKKAPLVDYFGNLIEVGDAYFYGSPPTAGRVIEIKRSSIVLQEYTVSGGVVCRVEPGEMTCKSPEKGICLDKKGFV